MFVRIMLCDACVVVFLLALVWATIKCRRQREREGERETEKTEI